MKRQDPVTSLIANNKEDFPGHAWVRDNLYGVHALWAMYRAYQKSAEFDEDLAKAHELKMEWLVRCISGNLYRRLVSKSCSLYLNA